jgi:hypothetical protein
MSGYSGYTGCKVRVDASTNTTAAAAATLAHQRQRAEGRVPVGVSSRTNPAQERGTMLRPPPAPLRVSASPVASSSHPTGWRGRRLATTAPTVAAVTAATTEAAVPAPNQLSSGRPAWRRS